MINIIQEIIHQMLNVQFEDEESSVIVVSEDEVRQGIVDCTNSCFGKFFSTKEINLRGLKSALTKASKCHDVKVFEVSANVFKFFFNRMSNCKTFLAEGQGILIFFS